ncbi:alcohol dehydrogenase catalytic domain-containing protein [Pleomorphomonas koreensis]|uniref:alcohol dehydrogenase catalytic domain-containing protein n=1 Tax=Pleomorphomonas koreensis TaxID=257440 RepID=UPI0003F76AD8|nr:alcohol dehydrogenase catalytic domain-containing protein [Pleomorphomonas koreensis]
METKGTNRWWPLHGRGLENFGVDGSYVTAPLPAVGDGEILARVEAATLCASDAKMVRLGEDYPLFGNRDLAADPACLGHELSLAVEVTRAGLAGVGPGTRLGVQPDLYTGGVRHCIGVDVTGGFADYILLGHNVMETDGGPMAFTVPPEIGRAATAMLEPLACVEGTFRLWGRSSLLEGGRLAVIAGEGTRDWRLDLPAPPDRVDLFGLSESRFRAIAGGLGAADLRVDPAELQPQYDDVVVLGAADPDRIGALFDRLADRGTFTWLAPGETAADVPIDLAHFHYSKLVLRGAPTLSLAEALARPIRCGYRPGGTTLIYGASGAMGRFHLERALGHPAGPARVVALARRRDRLDRLVDELRPLADEHGRALEAIAIEDVDFANRLARFGGDRGFDEAIVVAPEAEAFAAARHLVAADGLLVGFAGTRKGDRVPAPLGRLAGGLSITASSGSTVADQHEVIDRIARGELRAERHVAAVTGLAGLRDGIAALIDGRFTGKILLLPSVDWPLLSIDELLVRYPELAPLAEAGKYWSKEMEDRILGPVGSGGA